MKPLFGIPCLCGAVAQVYHLGGKYFNNCQSCAKHSSYYGERSLIDALEAFYHPVGCNYPIVLKETELQ